MHDNFYRAYVDKNLLSRYVENGIIYPVNRRFGNSIATTLREVTHTNE